MLEQTHKILKPLRDWNYAIPRCSYEDWYITVTLYEKYGEKNILDIGSFTGANTVYFAYLAKMKGGMVHSIDNWSQAHKAGVPVERARQLFYSYLDLLEVRGYCVFKEKEVEDIDDDDLKDVDFIFHDILHVTTEGVIDLIRKVKNKTIFILDDIDRDTRCLNSIIQHQNVKEFYRTQRRSYMTIFAGDDDKFVVEQLSDRDARRKTII
tara:strand:+ start:124 stop:750 length:627 start_codon:yes stop_codon:yes gene_type:complete